MTYWDEPEDRPDAVERLLIQLLGEENAVELPEERPYRRVWPGRIQIASGLLIIGAAFAGYLGYAPVLLCAGVVLVALGAGVFAESAGRRGMLG